MPREIGMIEGSCLCGKVTWKFDGPLESVTACNCTACRRYGTLWAYGYLDKEIKVSGQTKSYGRNRKVLGFHFCPECGCTAYWLATSVNDKGDLRIAVNTRLANDPEQVSALLIDHFDGLDTFDDLPRDGKCVKDLWF